MYIISFDDPAFRVLADKYPTKTPVESVQLGKTLYLNVKVFSYPPRDSLISLSYLDVNQVGLVCVCA